MWNTVVTCAEVCFEYTMCAAVISRIFDMGSISDLHTPGVCFFMTLPGPVPALDGWDAMLAAALRFAELLDAQVLDAQHNALGRQTIQHIRDELRAFDRKREKNTIKKSW